MPLFRFHRGGLKESLETTIIVKTFDDMVKAIVNHDSMISANPPWGAKFVVEPYPDNENNFDYRIGWYTHAVSTNLYGKDKMCLVGFLSEPFDYQ